MNLSSIPTKTEILNFLIELQRIENNDNRGFELDRQLTQYHVAAMIRHFSPSATKAKTNFAWISKAVAKKDIRNYLNFVVSDGVKMCATDGHRLHLAPVDSERSIPGFYCPKKGTLLAYADANFVANKELGTQKIYFAIVRAREMDKQPEHLAMNSNLFGLQYPDVERIFGTETRRRIDIDKDTIKSMLDNSEPLAPKLSRVFLSIGNGETIALNSEYFSNAMCNSISVRALISDKYANDSVVFEHGSDCLSVIMPMKK